jgi:hypothetical protein
MTVDKVCFFIHFMYKYICLCVYLNICVNSYVYMCIYIYKYLCIYDGSAETMPLIVTLTVDKLYIWLIIWMWIYMKRDLLDDTIYILYIYVYMYIYKYIYLYRDFCQHVKRFLGWSCPVDHCTLYSIYKQNAIISSKLY